jgi:hypothetical protein
MKLILISLTAILLLSLSAFYLNQQGYFQKSQVNLTTDNQSINASFKIAQKDQANVTAFSQNLGVSEEWTKGIHLKLDLGSSNFMNNLPPQLLLRFNPKEVNFESPGLPLLNSALPSKDYHFATESGKLDLRRISDKSYTLSITDPEPLAKYATSSSQLYFSNQLRTLFPILSKIATIELKMNGGSLRGVVRLK